MKMGLIDFYNLQDWWVNELSDEDRKKIEDTYKPMGNSEYSLTKGNASSSQPVTMFLVVLAGWFNNPRDRQIANKIILKADKVASQHSHDIIGTHFLYSEMISIYYPQRSENGMMDKVVSACKKQIELAPKAIDAFLREYPQQELPSHAGYNQLRIILKKEGKYSEAIRLCEQAENQKWSGDWDKNIEELKKKLSKKQS